jgi:hypothetical protein
VATRTKKPTQEELHALVDELVAGGRNRTEAFAHLCETHGMRAGTIAAAYYRVERQRQAPNRPRRSTVTPAATAEQSKEETTEQADQPTLTEVPRGQLAFDGFVIKDHKLKIAGTTVQLTDDEVREIKLGSELTFRFTARVVKRNNHLLTDDDGSHVEHDLVAVMEGVTRS